MPGTIDLQNVLYGPATFPILQGGELWYEFDVVFSGAGPPEEFDSTIRLQKPDGTTVRTFTGTVHPNGASTVRVKLSRPPGSLDFGSYKNHFEVTTSDPNFPTPYNQDICSGEDPQPEPCDECDPEATCEV